MKPITHPLAIAYVEAAARWTAAWRDPLTAQERARFDATTAAWADAGFPLYADPAPLPAPALGMRVWFQMQRETGESMESRDITFMDAADTWKTLSVPAALLSRVVLITDFRTNEVLWRRS